MGVTRRKDGRWATYWKEFGRKQWRYFRTEAEALAFDSQRKALSSKSFVPALGELALRYLAEHPVHHDTRNHIKACLSGPAADFLGTPADQLGRRDLNALREHGRDRGLSNSSINKNQAYISAILSWALDQELIQQHPWARYKRLKESERTYSMSADDFAAILAESPPWLAWTLKTVYALTIRPGKVEAFGLIWPAFRWDLGTVDVIQGKSGRRKTVQIPGWYAPEAWARCKDDQAAGIPWVCHRNGRQIKDMYGAWRGAVARAGRADRGFRPYDIRHLAISLQLAAGADLAAVSRQAGHASPFVTGSIYTHALQGAQAKAAALLPSPDSPQDVVDGQKRLPRGVVRHPSQLIDITPKKSNSDGT